MDGGAWWAAVRGQGQICLLLQVFPDFLLLHSSPLQVALFLSLSFFVVPLP